MTEPISIEMIAATSPFPGQPSCSIEWEGELNVSQLSDELTALVGVPVYAMAISTGEITRLYASPLADPEVLRSAAQDHDPDDDYGYTAEQRQKRALLARISAGETLSQEEVMRALTLSLGAS